MAFRVSDATLFNNAVRSARLNRFALSGLQNQLSSGKRINSSADDPTGASQILSLREGLSRMESFQKNIDGARAHLEYTESALSSLTDVLIRLRELAIQVDIESDEQLQNMKPEAEQLFDEVLRLANTKVGERFIFAGFNTDTAAFTKIGSFVDGVVDTSVPPQPYGRYDGDNGTLQVQIGEATTITASVTGRVVFLGSTDGDDIPDGGNVDIFNVIRDFRNRLEDRSTVGNPAEITDALDAAINQVLRSRTVGGATLNRLTKTEEQLSSVRLAVETRRSGIEDLDIIAAATELATLENTYQASLAVTARILQPSLLNFLG